MSNEVKLTMVGDAGQLSKTITDVGDAGAKMGDKLDGASKSVGDHGNSLGKMGNVADNSERNLIGIHDVIDGTATIMQGPGKVGMVTYIQGWADLAGGLAPLLISLAQTKVSVVANTIAMGAHATWAGIVTAATATWTGVQWLLNTSFLGCPLVWIVLMIAAVVAIIIVIATKTTWFQDIWRAAWGGIKTAAAAVWDWLSSLPGKIADTFSSVTNAISAPFKAGFNLIARAWNNTIGKLSWTFPSIFGIGGFTIRAPQLPTFHRGGVVPGLPGEDVLAVLQGGEKVLTREQQQAGAGGGVTNMYVTVNVAGLAELQNLLDWLDGLRNDGRRGLVGATS